MRPDSPDARVLVLAPTRADARLTAQVLLEQAGVATCCCDSTAEMAREIAIGAGAIIVTDDAAQAEPFEDVRFMLARQPSWSDVPLYGLHRIVFPRSVEFFSIRSPDWWPSVPSVVMYESSMVTLL